MATIPERVQMLPDFRSALMNQPAELSDDYPNRLVEARINGYISYRQALISFTKWMHDFNTTDVDADLARLVGEVAEALEARATKTNKDLAEELADICIYCYGIATMIHADLETEIETKMEYNLERTYQAKE